MAAPYDRIAGARAALTAAGIPSADAAIDAEVLARHALGWDRAKLLADGRRPEPEGFGAAYARLIERRARREPVAQITGERQFWGLDFEVTGDVLVPRPETELIVEEALNVARNLARPTIIDVGTGSGNIAIALAHELPEARVVAVDRSPAALAVARRNAQRHSVERRIEFLHGDLFANTRTTADLVVSNPPYVPESDATVLQAEVVRYEPHLALFGGPDGLAIIRRLLEEAPAQLARDGRLIVEFGIGQVDAVRACASETGWSVEKIRQDLQHIPRTAVLRRDVG